MGSILLSQSSTRKVIKFFNEIEFELGFIVSQPFMYDAMKSSFRIICKGGTMF